MLIRTTTDPMTLHDVSDLDAHPSLFEGNADYGLEIHFESEETRREYMELHPHDPKILDSNDDEDYVAEG